MAMHGSHLQAGDVTEASRPRAKSVPRRRQAGLLLPPVRFTPSVEGWPGFDLRYDAQVPRGRSLLTHGRTSVTFMC